MLTARQWSYVVGTMPTNLQSHHTPLSLVQHRMKNPPRLPILVMVYVFVVPKMKKRDTTYGCKDGGCSRCPWSWLSTVVLHHQNDKSAQINLDDRMLSQRQKHTHDHVDMITSLKFRYTFCAICSLLCSPASLTWRNLANAVWGSPQDIICF